MLKGESMKITAITLGLLNVPMLRSIKTPIGEISAAKNIVVRIDTDTDLMGWGEASPMASITGDSQASSYALAADLAPLLIGNDALAIEDNIKLLRHSCAAGVSTLCAFDMALYDLCARAANMPLYQFLGGKQRPLQTDHTIGNQESVESTVSLAERLISEGYDTIKLKTGRKNLEDIAHVAAVRKALGREVKIRIDCNQGWDYPEAIANIKHLESLDIEYLEQPLPAWDIEGFARLRRETLIPICADETLFNERDALRLIREDAVDFMNIKLVKSGGINTALKINALAESAGIRCMIGCFGESRLGLSASAHLAMARPNIEFIDLDSALHFSHDPVQGGMNYEAGSGGKIIVPDDPGLGVSISDHQLDKVKVIS